MYPIGFVLCRLDSLNLYLYRLCTRGGCTRRHRATFSISRWKKLTDLLGAQGGAREALAGFSDEFLADFLVDKIVVRKGIATHGGEHVGGELSLRDGFCDRHACPAILCVGAPLDI